MVVFERISMANEAQPKFRRLGHTMESHFEGFGDEGHADGDAIESLLEIAGLGELVDALHDLIDAWEWVHEGGVGLHLVDHFWAENEGIFDFIELLDVIEAFFLHTGVVDDICSLEDLVGERGVNAVATIYIFGRHLDDFWGDELEGDSIVIT